MYPTFYDLDHPRLDTYETVFGEWQFPFSTQSSLNNLNQKIVFGGNLGPKAQVSNE